MIVERHAVKADERYLTAAGLDPGKCLYFDIETTGLKAETSHLYLIGYAVRENGNWQIIQLFAEKTREEETLLKRFADVCAGFRTLVQFNGDRFDLPYLESKYREHSLKSPFVGMSTVDIYRMARPYKELLGLERMNQKSVERFLGIRRRDPYDGGQLIEVYRAYRDRRSEDRSGDLGKLMLHNYEDVLGMFSLTSLLAYPLALGGGIQDRSPDAGHDLSVRIRHRPQDVSGEERTDELVLSFRIPVPAPVQASLQKDWFRILIDENQCECAVTVREDELFHFFPDFRNYDYLPEEDRAVHRSVAQFVDSRHRVRAKADNCYVRARGRFIPVPAGADFDRVTYPVFHEFRREKTEWIMLTKELLSRLQTDHTVAAGYLKILLDSAVTQGRTGTAGKRRKQKNEEADTGHHGGRNGEPIRRAQTDRSDR